MVPLHRRRSFATLPLPVAPRVLRAALLAAIVLLPSPPSRADQHEVPEEAPAPSHIFSSAPVVGTLLLPQGDPPLGAVLLLHDSLGADARAAAYADQFLPAGIAVLDVQLTGGSASDIAAAAQALSQHPRIGGRPVGLVGFGAGGRLALAVTAGIAAHAVFYPGCAGVAPLLAPSPGHPVALIHGDADPANPPDSCAALAARMQALDYRVRLFVYRDAGYAWDYPLYGTERRMLLPRPDGAGRIAATPWPELAGMSASQLAGFMRGVFLDR